MKEFDSPGEGGNGTIGWKVRRKEESQLSCLTVKDIFKVWNDSIEKTVECHSRPIFRQAENATALGVKRQEKAQGVRGHQYMRNKNTKSVPNGTNPYACCCSQVHRRHAGDR